MLKYIKSKIQRFCFNLEIKIIIKQVAKIDDLFTYPILLTLEFKKEWYWRRYTLGHTIKSSLLKQTDTIYRRANRIFTTEAARRLEYIRKIRWAKEEIAEIELQYQKHLLTIQQNYYVSTNPKN